MREIGVIKENRIYRLDFRTGMDGASNHIVINSKITARLRKVGHELGSLQTFGAVLNFVDDITELVRFKEM